MKTAYIVMAKKDVANFLHAEDRAYFSKPVLVEIICERPGGIAGLLTVTDHVRGHTYPCSRTSLRSKYQLTQRQVAAAEAAAKVEADIAEFEIDAELNARGFALEYQRANPE